MNEVRLLDIDTPYCEILQIMEQKDSQQSHCTTLKERRIRTCIFSSFNMGDQKSAILAHDQNRESTPLVTAELKDRLRKSLQLAQNLR